MKVRKAVIPVAGFGTRMLPVTKSIPKEMLPLVDKPLIHFIVEECVTAGITDIILVDHSLKTAVGNYFDTHYELEDKLKKKNKIKELEEAQLSIPNKITLASVRQGEAKGLGHAVLTAKALVGNEPFVVLLPDDIIEELELSAKKNNLRRMVENFESNNTSQILVERVPDELVNQYGIVGLEEGSLSIENILEKPDVNEAPSNLAVVGRYVFSPGIWSFLENQKPGKAGEIQLTDSIQALLGVEQVDAFELQGKRWDCGSKQGYVDTFIHYAKKRGYV